MTKHKMTARNSQLTEPRLHQAAIHHLPISEFHLKIEQSEIIEQATRLLQALYDLTINDGKGRILLNTIMLQRALKTRMWGDKSCDDLCLVQLPNFSHAVAEQLSARGIRTFDVCCKTT